MRPSKAEEGNAFLAGGASVKMSLSGGVGGCGGQNAKMPMCTVRRKEGWEEACIHYEGRAGTLPITSPLMAREVIIGRGTRRGTRMRHSIVMPRRSTNLPVSAACWLVSGRSWARSHVRLAVAANSFKIHCHLGVGWKPDGIGRGLARRAAAAGD